MIKISGKYYKYVRLVLNLLAWCALGAMNEILSPTLPDLSLRVDADYQEMGRTVGFRVIGNLFTPFLSGLLYDRFPRSRELGFGLIFVAGGALSVAIPHCRTVWLLSLVLIAQGVTEGALVTAAQSTIIELFAASAAAALQFMHLGWAVGSFAANLLVRPFLAPNLRLSRAKINYPCLPPLNASANETEVLDNSGSRIEIAYLVIGLYAITAGVILFLFAFIPKPASPHQQDSNAAPKKSLQAMIGPASISDGRPAFGAFMLLSLLLIYTTEIGAYVNLSRYLVTIAIDPCKAFVMTQADATSLQSASAAVFSAGRIASGVLIGLLLLRRVQPGFVIVASTVGSTLAVSLLSAFGLQHRAAFWALVCIYAFCHGPFYGGCTPWFNQYIRCTSTVVAVAVTGSNLGKLAFSWLGGYLFKSHSSQAFLHMVNGLLAVMVSAVIAVFVVSMRVGPRPSYDAPPDSPQVKAEEEVTKI